MQTLTSRRPAQECRFVLGAPEGVEPARYERLQDDPHFRDYPPFHEYFDGDTGCGGQAGRRMVRSGS